MAKDDTGRMAHLSELAGLQQRILDEQAAFDKMEELYLQERESFRIIKRQLDEAQYQYRHHANHIEKNNKRLRIMLREVLFQFEGLVQFCSEDDYLDDELEALFVGVLKEARKLLRKP